MAGQLSTVPKPGTLRRRVYDGLENLLADTDTYPPGTRLPTYRALRQQYGVAQAAVSAAMEALASQGRVWIRPPQGVFVLGEGHEPTPTKAVLIATAARERIADGTLKPGTPLVPLLAREFGTNASVVSSALRPLAAEGLLVAEPFSGTYVSPGCAPDPDHREPPLNAGATRTTTPATATLAPGAPYDRDGGRAALSEGIPAVSPHEIGTSLRAHAARAVYQQVVDMLADTDTYPPGSTLPAQSALAERLGVTSYALRKAMRALEADGLVQRCRWRTIVLGKDSNPAPVPTTVRLIEIVRDRIQDGTIKPGEPISGPLQREFGVSKTTVRNALAPLGAEGLLVARQGVGTYAPHPPAEATANPCQSSADTTSHTTDAARPRPRAVDQ
ncbi:GntR family transcriptional regulator [Streptomyces sp. NPDC089173]|uniref:GntR family transcriptional regulator n=1 Tax=Streptomyces sp. NPDC089173 TaxID=3154965 RepID=UPI00344FE844